MKSMSILWLPPSSPKMQSFRNDDQPGLRGAWTPATRHELPATQSRLHGQVSLGKKGVESPPKQRRRDQRGVPPRAGDGDPQVPPLRHGEGRDGLVLVRGAGAAALHREHLDALRQQAGHLTEGTAAHQHAVRLDHARHGFLHARPDVKDDVLVHDLEDPVASGAAELTGPFLGAVIGCRGCQAARYLKQETRVRETKYQGAGKEGRMINCLNGKHTGATNRNWSADATTSSHGETTMLRVGEVYLGVSSVASVESKAALRHNNFRRTGESGQDDSNTPN